MAKIQIEKSKPSIIIIGKVCSETRIFSSSKTNKQWLKMFLAVSSRNNSHILVDVKVFNQKLFEDILKEFKLDDVVKVIGYPDSISKYEKKFTLEIIPESIEHIY